MKDNSPMRFVDGWSGLIALVAKVISAEHSEYEALYHRRTSVQATRSPPTRGPYSPRTFSHWSLQTAGHLLAAFTFLAAVFAACGESSPSRFPDAGDGGNDGDPPLEIEPELPLSDCDVAFDRVYEIPETVSARAWSVVELPNGHFVIAGEVEPEEQTTLWDMDGFLMEVDSDGDLVWTRIYGQEDTGESDTEVLKRIHSIPDGLLAFGTKVEDSENRGAWALRTNSDGGVVWGEILPTSGTSNTYQMDDHSIQYLGGDHAGKKVLATVDDQANFEEQFSGVLEPYFTTGWNRISSGHSAFFGHLYEDDVGGNYLPNEETYDYPFTMILGPDYQESISRTFEPGRSGGFTALAETTDGQFLFGGWLLFDDWFWGAYVARVTLGGDVLWQRFYGNNGGKSVSAIVNTDAGYVFVDEVGGFGSYDGYFARIDEDGDLVWHFVVDRVDEDYFTGAIRTSDGGYLAVGFGDDWNDLYGRKPWLVKIAPNEECY